MDTRISGIPCQVEVTHYSPAVPMKYWRYEEYWQPPEPEEIEFQVLDRRGRPAPWLERKLDEQDRRRIEQELKATYHNELAEDF